MNSFKSKL